MSDMERWAAGFILSVLLALLAVIWRQLHARFDTKDISLENRLEEMERSLKEKISTSDAQLKQLVTDQLGQISTRLTNGSTRMDTLNTSVANLRVKLAEEYHSATEVRILITDLIAPQKEQLNRMEQTLNLLVRDPHTTRRQT